MVETQVTRELEKHEPYTVNEHKEGTTTDSYANAMSFDCIRFKTKNIVLKNTDGSNHLLYKVLKHRANPNKAGVESTLVDETQLNAGEEVEFQYTGSYYRIIVQVKAATAESQATYSLDYAGFPV